ncbi:MAG: PCRF domain-containing protein [Planctomycetota bacterium]|nr:MAG: PCRF domain-containing protein [Planctomycetota bacterium]
MREAPTSIPEPLRDRLERARARRDELAALLTDPGVLSDPGRVRDLSIEQAALEPLARRADELAALEGERADLLAAAGSGDRELAELAREELPAVESRLATLADDLIARLVTAEDDAVGSVMLEIRAGVGGEEASLWAGDLLAMYQKFAASRGWVFEPIEVAATDSGGVRHAVVGVRGEGVWRDLAAEAGTHCVKRVPATESQGRIHTSTATVAVLPEPTEVQVTIDPADVQERITTAQGPGGQNVNKVATAVHLIHGPTGVEVRMQETKSQRQNREKAWRLLRARVYEREREKQSARRDAERAAQIGSAGRAERVRTYRYKDNRAVDHRLGESFNLDAVLAGGLDPIVAGLIRKRVEDRLAAR